MESQGRLQRQPDGISWGGHLIRALLERSTQLRSVSARSAWELCSPRMERL